MNLAETLRKLAFDLNDYVKGPEFDELMARADEGLKVSPLSEHYVNALGGAKDYQRGIEGVQRGIQRGMQAAEGGPMFNPAAGVESGRRGVMRGLRKTEAGAAQLRETFSALSKNVKKIQKSKAPIKSFTDLMSRLGK